MNHDIVIHSASLTKQFGSFVAVDAISFDIPRGEIFGFLGANGAGKTTAIRMLCGLLTPTSGGATVAGFNVFTEQEKVKQHIGYMSQKFSLYANLTAWENLMLYGGVYGLKTRELKAKAQQLISDLGIEAYKDQRVHSLPLGWKQKIAFSAAMMHEPAVIFLDEPTGGVDPITRRQFWEMIIAAAGKGVTVFVTTHYMDEAEYCDRVSIMVDGKIAALDTPENLKTQLNTDSMDGVFLQLARNATRAMANG
jgi:ABC-2 type transport system ATP-binding protein